MFVGICGGFIWMKIGNYQKIFSRENWENYVCFRLFAVNNGFEILFDYLYRWKKNSLFV